MKVFCQLALYWGETMSLITSSMFYLQYFIHDYFQNENFFEFKQKLFLVIS